jgi:hypothetical protein
MLHYMKFLCEMVCTTTCHIIINYNLEFTNKMPQLVISWYINSSENGQGTLIQVNQMHVELKIMCVALNHLFNTLDFCNKFHKY